MKQSKENIKKARDIKKAREGFLWSVLFLVFVILCWVNIVPLPPV